MEIEENEDMIISKLDFSRSANYNYIKRFLDIVLAIIGILFLFAPFLIVAMSIKMDDPKGSILFKQKRLGKNESPFLMFKFRSMYSDAEERLNELLHHNEIEGAMFKMKNDPRITPVGRIIRKYSIDEFPQLINVLRGEMSLVGPRPPLPREVQEYTTYDRQRLLTTPGITGLWQVSGRNSLSFEEMVILDLEYIKTVSLINDLKILMKTISVVVRSSDAY